eukprot:CAMPEP_0119082896 /NCGR_PEP_ID=MMETSP1178-20130426/123487_1 /TAXON_ID=33656 /ORGANISM="unid sp, Strain CCMP2000" /LENGTH=52 /DNA_ID=CAMNT_0007065713 /DNA_START=529 /DNA_END=687 /DNA_ORIENTATION=+
MARLWTHGHKLIAQHWQCCATLQLDRRCACGALGDQPAHVIPALPRTVQVEK